MGSARAKRGITARKLFLMTGATYANTLREIYGASVVWPLVDMYSGTTIHSVPTGYEGAATGFDLQNTAGPVEGEGKAPYLDGANDFGDLYTAALASLFNSDEGAVSIWVKMSAGAWTDSAVRMIIELHNDNVPDDNRLAIYKLNVDNQLGVLFRGGGTASINTAVAVTPHADWFQVFMRWSVSGNNVRFGVNGVQDAAGVHNAWTEGIADGYCALGARLTAGSQSLVHNGWLAYAALWAGTAPSVADFLAMYNEVAD